jgi:hypothetical protein
MESRKSFFYLLYVIGFSLSFSVCLYWIAGLPDVFFSYQKCQFGFMQVRILEVLGMENIGIFYDHWEYWSAIWYISMQFGIVCHHLVYFSRFGRFGPRKIWQP